MIKKQLATTLTSLVLIPAASAVQLEEVVVTAQKRKQSLQEVALSISAISSNEVVQLQLNDVASLATLVPNLNALDNAAGNPSFRIRGIGLNEFSAAYDSPVGIHLDETFLYRPVLASIGFFDIERVEVLKGPQGTVFGRNTTGGAVNFYSNRPTEEFSATARLRYGRFERTELEGHISGALSNNLRGRLAIQVKDYANNEGPWLNLFDNRRIGDLEQHQARAMLEWNGERTTVLSTIEIGNKEGDLTPYDNLFQSSPGAHPTAPTIDGVWNPAAEIRNPMSRSTYNADYSQRTDSDYWGARFRVDHEFAIGTLTSLTSYKDFKRLNREDSDNTPTRSVNIDWNSRLESFSQELRLSADNDSYTYLVGAYFEDDSSDIVELVDSRDFLGAYFGDDFTTENRSWALFANTEVRLSPTWSAVVGARYTEEKVAIRGDGFMALPNTAIGSFSTVEPGDRMAIISVDDDRNDTDFNWKVGLNYTPSDDLLLYGFLSTGFRSGGFDMTFGGLALSNPVLTFEPEDVVSYEFGIKSTLLEGAMIFNASAFMTEVDNYQDNVNQGAEIVPRRRNVGTLDTQGFEADLQWQISERWVAKWGAGYTDAKVTNSDETVNGLPIEGTTPVNTPEWSSNAVINYRQPLSNKFVLDALVSAQWQDKRYLEPDNGPDHIVEAFHTIDATISLVSPDERWRFSIWGKNITDEEYLVYINDVPAFGLFLTIRGEPATYGVSAEYQL